MAKVWRVGDTAQIGCASEARPGHADVGAFRADLLAQGRKPSTVKAYTDTAARLVKYLGGRAIDAETLRSFVRGLRLSESPLAPSSLHLHAAAGARFVAWLRTARGWAIPAVHWPELPPKTHRTPPTLTDEQVAGYLDALRRVGEPAATALALLPLTGLHPGEVCGLQASDLEIAPPTPTRPQPQYVLAIQAERSHGGAARRVPVLVQPGTALLYRYTETVRWRLAGYAPTPSSPLFPAADGQPLTLQYIQKRLARLRDRLDLAAVSADAFRRWYVAGLVRDGLGVEQIQAILGHRHAATTARYTPTPSPQE